MSFKTLVLAILCISVFSCQEEKAAEGENTEQTETLSTETGEDDFVWSPEEFADIKMIRYQIPGFEKLTTKQKALVYFLTEAGLAGRDIIWDQNYRHNLTIRKALETVYQKYKGDRDNDTWKKFEVYLKKVWFANGIHHHYSMDKFNPGFSRKYFQGLLNAVGFTVAPDVLEVMFNPDIDAKKVSLDNSKDLLTNSAVNLYGPDVTYEEAKNFYEKMADKSDPKPISYGLNSKLMRRPNGELEERVYKLNGMYSTAITSIIEWLKKASRVAENDKQKKAIDLLIEYYETGDLRKWDEYSIAWVEATEGDIDYINGFIEVYQDPIGYKATFESVVQINDFDASERMQVVAENAQWFEDNSSILDAHKKKNVVGVSYKVVVVAGGSGDVSPSSPIGINLPNATWIRKNHGSKSVSLGNIINAYANSSGPGILAEFAHDEEEIARVKKYGKLAGKIHTALHEVIGHASGQINEGVGTPKETMKSYASTIEEGRADLVALYFMMDEKLVEMGIMPSLEVGKAEYDSYIRNGLMTQLRRIKEGKDVEESHMRNRQFVAKWVYEKGKADNVIAEVKKGGKTYYDIQDYNKLKVLFGELLRETQRMTSEGDFTAAQNLVEGYGVKVDPEIHKEVLARSAKLNIPPYGGFINPKLTAKYAPNGTVADVIVEYPDSFAKQMLEYSANYSFLPNYN